MAMNAGVFKNEMKAALKAALEADYTSIADDHELGGYTFDDYLEKFCTAITNSIVFHISNNARATGLDSRGDTHDLPVA